MVAGFEGQCLGSFPYLLIHSLTIFGSAGIQQLFLKPDIPSCLKLLFASTLQLGCTEGPWIGKKILIFAWSCRQVANLIISVLLFGRGRHGSVLKCMQLAYFSAFDQSFSLPLTLSMRKLPVRTKCAKRRMRASLLSKSVSRCHLALIFAANLKKSILKETFSSQCQQDGYKISCNLAMTNFQSYVLRKIGCVGK